MRFPVPLLPVIMLLMSACMRSGELRQDMSDTAKESDSLRLLASGGDFTAMALHKADSLLKGMTLEQRVGQCFMPTIVARDTPDVIGLLSNYTDSLHVGGVVLLDGDLRSASRMAERCSEVTVPLFIAIDAEWGLGMRLSDAPVFPLNGSLPSGIDEQTLYDYGREVARECRSVGINMVLGPVVDVAANPYGVIGKRSFGGNPERVADLGVAYAKGVESGGVVSVAKHFPGHGSPAADSHKTLPVIGRSLHQLDSIDLYPFRRYIDAGLTGVMAGHLAVPAIDPEALPAAVSPVVIQDLLRGEMQFEGLVLTDALNMKGAEGYGGVAALAAGADMIIGPVDTSREIAEVVEAVKKGPLKEETVNEHCRRVLFYKSLFSLGRVSVMRDDSLREALSSGAEEIRKRLLLR